MGLVSEIIQLAFGLMLGSVVVAAAMTVGIGGREFAARLLDEWGKAFKRDQ